MSVERKCLLGLTLFAAVASEAFAWYLVVRGPMHFAGDRRLLDEVEGPTVRLMPDRAFYAQHFSSSIFLRSCEVQDVALVPPPRGGYVLVGAGSGRLTFNFVAVTARPMPPNGRMIHRDIAVDRYNVNLHILSLACVAMAACLIGVAAARQRRRLRLGLCVRCGYDLRASSSRCPECGTKIPDKKLAAIRGK